MSQRETTRDTEETPECPTCGRTDFKSQLGMQQHHAWVHGERLTIETVICNYCGDDIERHHRMNEKGDQNFCDLDCFGKWAAENRSGENHPQYKGAKSEVECSYCGEVFIKKNNKIERSERDYCSPECWDRHRSEVMVGENNPNYNRIEVECEMCGELLMRIKSRVENSDFQVCGLPCLRKWTSENQVGENSPVWNGGSPDYYGKDWTFELKESIRDRDNRRCQDCGIESTLHREKYGRRLNVHHIQPVSSFENRNDAHYEENLITLCSGCHKKWDHIPGLRPT